LTFVSTRCGQFTYFSQQAGEAVWHGKKVLDFGGNIGNILRDPNSTIDHSLYWCLDVDRESVEMGKQKYPEANWRFYNRFSFFFNPQGIHNLPIPDLGHKFDYIVAYSVFTNTSQADMLQLVDQLEKLLADQGTLIFTFIDPYYFSWGAPTRNNFQWRLDLETEHGNISNSEAESLDRRAQNAEWFILVNGSDLFIETDDVPAYDTAIQRTFHVFHTEQYMKRLFPQATILPPANNEMQHGCVLRKG
jgi:SAM-dependent methyltransferase